MRHVGDRMIISPPLILTKSDVDTMIERAERAIDEAYHAVRDQGLFKSA